MKKIIAFAIAGAFVAPAYAADVTLSGDIEMQWIAEDGEGLATANNDGDITVTATEELANGVSVSAKVAVEDVQTAAGAGDVELHLTGAFGKLSLGEVDAAANAVDERDPAGDLFAEAGVGSSSSWCSCSYQHHFVHLAINGRGLDSYGIGWNTGCN